MFDGFRWCSRDESGLDGSSTLTWGFDHFALRHRQAAIVGTICRAKTATWCQKKKDQDGQHVLIFGSLLVVHQCLPTKILKHARLKRWRWYLISYMIEDQFLVVFSKAYLWPLTICIMTRFHTSSDPPKVKNHSFHIVGGPGGNPGASNQSTRWNHPRASRTAEFLSTSHGTTWWKVQVFLFLCLYCHLRWL